MDNNMTFDPTAWAAAPAGSQQTANTENDQPQAGQVTNPQPAAHPSGNELERVSATIDELARLGVDITDVYLDWFKLGCAFADSLGAEGRDPFHRLSALSPKYNEADCEKKWRECLAKHDGRATIASFYFAAQQAGVDISAICRRFPSLPSNPQSSEGQSGTSGNGVSRRDFSADNNSVIPTSDARGDARRANPKSGEGSEGCEGSADCGNEAIGTEAIGYTRTFSDSLDIANLPSLLREPVETQTDAEGRDKVVLAALTLYSGRMPAVYGIYDGKRVYPPFYTLIDAPSGADKGVISDCRQLLMPIEWEIRADHRKQTDDYQQQLARYNALDRKQRAQEQEPQKPAYQSVFIAANSSATATYQQLSDNGEWGVIFETEADTLASALKQDYGDYSDGLRKAFHHERISYSRRKDDEHVNVECPRLAALLTCTPGQVPLLLSPQQVENGLANRFLFYNLSSRHEWRNVFAQCEEPLSDRLAKVGQRYLTLYHDLLERTAHPLEFVLGEDQKRQFNDYFSHLLLEQIGLHGEQLDAFVKRLGLATYRLAMVLTVLRCEERQPMLDPLSQTLVCCDHDFRAAMTIADCLISHTTHVYANLLPHDEQPLTATLKPLSAQELSLYRALPSDFTTGDAQQAAQRLGIAWKSAERYIGQFVSRHHIAERIRYGQYRKR